MLKFCSPYGKRREFLVNPGSKAAQRGIREGDLITSINGESTNNLTNNEAHNLLKRSGSTLKLGLNEDIEGSPKKRHYRTIHHETHQETVKRSSVSYTLKETIERSSSRSQRNNEYEAFKSSEFINGRDTKQNGSGIKVVTNIPVSQLSTSSSSSTSTPSTLVPEGRNISSDHAIASRQSSYSNCSSIPDEGPQPGNQQNQDPESQEMNDGQDRMSKSKKRRQRRKNLLNRSVSQENQRQSEVEIDEVEQKEPNVVLEPVNKNLEVLRLKRIEHKYKVESPKELRIEQHIKSNQKKLKTKSKSLDDDDDLLRIQELSEASESEDPKCQTHVIITEASSEENLLEEFESDRRGRLQLNLDNQLESTSHISPEEEQALRHFLGGLNLVNSPEESAQDLYERTTGLNANDSKAKKQQKRKELEEYFKPIADNPRYLDAISEEASDLSDKESGVAKRAIRHLKQGTPEHGLEPILVEAKVLESVPRGTCSIEVVPVSEEMAEVVYLEDSSESSLSTSSIDKEAEINCENVQLIDGTGSASCEPEVTENTLKKVSAFNGNVLFGQLTPPPTPDGVATKTKSASSFVETRMHFDYTRMPNVLKEKEPASGHVNGDGRGESLNKKSVDSIKTGIVNGNLNDPKFEKIVPDTLHGEEVRNDFSNDEAVVKLPDENSKIGIKVEKLEKKSVNDHIVDEDEVNKNFPKAIIYTELRNSHKRTENKELIDEFCKNCELERSKEEQNKDIIDEREYFIKFNEKIENGDVKVMKNIDEETTNPNKDILSGRDNVVQNKAVTSSEKTENSKIIFDKTSDVKMKEDFEEQNSDKKMCKETTVNELKNQKETFINIEKTFNEHVGRTEIKKIEKMFKETLINEHFVKDDEKMEKNGLNKGEILLKETSINNSESEKESLIDINKKIANVDVIKDLKQIAKLNKERTLEESSINIDKTWKCDKKGSNGNTDKVELKKITNGDRKIKEDLKEQINEKTNDKEVELIINVEKTMQCDKKIRQKLEKVAENGGKEKDSNQNKDILNENSADIGGKLSDTLHKGSDEEVRHDFSKENYTYDEAVGKPLRNEDGFTDFAQNVIKLDEKNSKIEIKVEKLEEKSANDCIDEDEVNKNIPKAIVHTELRNSHKRTENNELTDELSKNCELERSKDEQNTDIINEKEYFIKFNEKIEDNEHLKVDLEKLTKNSDVKIRKDFEEQTSKQNTNKTIVNELKNQKETFINIEKTFSEHVDRTELFKETSIDEHFVKDNESIIDINKKITNVNIRKDLEKIAKLTEEKKIANGEMKIKEDLKEQIKEKTNNTKIDLFVNVEKVSKNCGKEKRSNQNKDILNGNSADIDGKLSTERATKNESKTQKESFINIEKTCQSDKKIEDKETVQSTSETKKESVLKHVIMTSKDSNKTDSQKLLEFESIKKLNCELKEKINKQELIGRTFKSSLMNTVPEPVVMHCDEELPSKDFIERRVKEFSKQNNKETKNNIETEKHCNKLIQSRIKTFSNERNGEQQQSVCDESVLKRIIEENNSPIDKKHIETMIPVKLEYESKTLSDEKEKICEKKLESSRNHSNKEVDNAVNIIPIQLEDSNQNNDKDNNESSRSGVEQKTNKQVKIIPIEVDTHERIIPIKIENTPKPSDNVTTNVIKNINKSLINIVEKKPEKQPIKSQNEPPIPPPRRSKAFLLRKRNETNIAQAQGSKEDIPVSSDMTYTNILSPPRPASVSSDSSASEGSSRCTAKYNPNSSIADVASIAKDEDTKVTYEPMSLRDIVLKRLMSLPFGEEILKELAEVSKAIGSFSNNLPFRGLESINKNNNISVDGRNESMPGHWYTTESDTIRNSYGDERRKIMELHQKFLASRKYNDEDPNISKHHCEDITRQSEVTSPNRLLTIIREEPNESEPANDFLYYESNADQRLKAKNLGEWLTLARNKSKSTSSLDRTNIPINNLRRTVTSTQNEPAKFSNTRRLSLPQEIYEEQLITIMEKEREIQRELEKLEEEKRKLRAEIAPSRQREFQVDDFYVSKKGDFAERKETIGEKRERPASMPVFPTEFFRQQMYEEYMDKFSEREERKQQKVIKISSSNDLEQDREPHLKTKEIIHPIEIEQEFMDRVKEKQKKNHRETLTEAPEEDAALSNDASSDEAPVIVLDGDKVRGIEALPPHLQEFVGDLATQQEASIWSPGQPRRPPPPQSANQHQRTDSQFSQDQQDDPVSPVWTPKSANSSPTVERKEFRPVNFQSPVLSRKNRTRSETIATPDSTTSEPPWRLPEGSSDSALNLSSTLERRLPTSQSSPGFGLFSTASRLPKAQNPTITLLQKAREGQLPRGAHYIDQDRRPPNDRPPIKYPGEVLYHIKNEYTSESDSEKPKKMADLTPRKFEGIGPTTKDGMPLILRSEVKDKDQSKWYKRMYDTIHKQKPHKDEFITVRYKQKRAHYPYSSGYLSEPEPGAYDSDFTEYKYQTLDRRRTPQTHHYINSSNSATMPRSVPDSRSYSSSDIIRSNHEKYNNQPGRIENYRPGHSSISEKEAKQWWDEVMDIFDGHLEQQSRVPAQKQRSFINQALKESGYESDSTLVFKRKQETAASQLSPKEQREAYKMIQKGGDVPFQGLRKPAPERPKEPDLPPPPPPPKSQGGVRSQEQESPRKYVENEVTIHYKTPVRTEIKEYVSEDELAHRQAEAMKKIYEEERKRKYLQELQDMKSRRHTDNFIPSQKSPIPLNRYDDFDDLATPTKTRPRSPEPRLVARALYNFLGQSARELTFRKGDLIYVRRQVDKNWYEGELNAMVGLFPVNYVEIVPYEGIKTTPRKAHEGQARAKYNFVAQTHLELSLAKGELVTITRRVDDNWFEGKIGGRKGIFPVSYVDVLIDPSEPPPSSNKPVAAPAAHSLLLNGSAQGKESMGSHLYTPNIPNPITSRGNGYHHAKPIQLTGAGTYSTLPKSNKSPIDQALHIETHSEPIPYRALYKYTPQNDDELELLEGDTVYVLEKCDDGWYVGSSDRTGAFGTFPGNYVEKI